MSKPLLIRELSEAKFTVDKVYGTELRRKREVFRAATRTRKNILITMVTVYGIAALLAEYGLSSG